MPKPKHKTISLDPQVLERLREIAERENRTMASQVKHWIEQEYFRQLQKGA